MQRMSWRGKRVLVMGLGLFGGGVGTARYFAEQGAQVTVTDLRSADTLRPSLEKLTKLSIRYVLDGHRTEDFRRADLVIRNPGVPDDSPYLAVARAAGAPIENEAGLFLAAAPSFVIGVTGTKGKSTTATLIAEALKAAGIEVELTGIPKTSFLASLERLGGRTVVVGEFSSWDLQGVEPHRMSPPVAVMTNFLPDHLNRHGTMRAYASAKRSIFRFQNAEDVLVIPDGDTALDRLVKGAPGQVRRVGKREETALPRLKLVGAHQRRNAALALAVTEEAFRHPHWPVAVRVSAALARGRRAIAAFPGLPGRLEVIAETRGRIFINDTTATNPNAACAALASIEPPIILIVGGQDKRLFYGDFANAIARRVKHTVLLEGSATEKIQRGFADRRYFSWSGPHRSMRDAVLDAWRASIRGDTILFSPGAASFNLFHNEFDRGAQFNEAVRVIAKT